MNALSERAMLITLNIRSWSARKIDKRITREIADTHGAVADAGRYNKLLLPKEALTAITKIDNEARSYFYSVTSPWLDAGGRVVSNINFPTASAKLQAYRQDREREVALFVPAYPDLREARRADLGDLFDESDYPDPRDIEKRFEFRVQILPLPDAADFRVAMAEGQVDEIREQIQAASDAALRTAMRDAWERVAGVTERMRERLRAYTPGSEGTKATGVFHDTLVSNVRELAELLPGLNLANDPAMAAIAQRLRDELAGYDAETLRERADLREETADAAEDILAHVRGYLS
jgi:hypothetical protein